MKLGQGLLQIFITFLSHKNAFSTNKLKLALDRSSFKKVQSYLFDKLSTLFTIDPWKSWSKKKKRKKKGKTILKHEIITLHQA